MSYSTQATEVFNRLVAQHSSATVGSANRVHDGLDFTEAKVDDYLLTCDDQVRAEVTDFMHAVTEFRSAEYKHAFFLHLIAIFSTIEEMARHNLAELMMFQTAMQNTQSCLMNNCSKCCYFKVQSYYHQALVRSTPENEKEDLDEDDNVNDEVTELSAVFTRLYGVCCRVMWQVIGRKRHLDRLELEAQAESAAEGFVSEIVNRSHELSVEEARNGEAACAPKDEADKDPGGGDQLHNQYAATQHVLASFRDGLADCKCLDAVLLHELGPSRSERQQQTRKKAKKLVAWRRRIQGIATEGDLLKPSPLSLPPITAESDN
ncbi:hypothetical protein F5Y06DRAFT_307459 [Hypoxylon sp. FL0890]|nr:hypothetical protein F5Y06DRAFT_307459 [Hypoxylon sp. FL0890]